MTIIKNKITVEDLPDHPIHPGVTLKETLDYIGMTQAELARRMERPIKTINEIIKGKASITADTSIQLERVLGVSSKLWLNLEANFQMAKARVAEREKLQQEAQYVAEFPYPEMAKLGWVKKSRKLLEKTSQLLDYFGVVSLKNVKTMHKVAFRKSKCREASSEAIAAWLRKGELQGRKLKTKSYNRTKFLKMLTYIKSNILDSKEFSKQLKELCSKCGVAVVFTPHLKSTYVNGASRWLSSDKALLQLSILNRYQDIFWFSFFHEAAHILKHNKKEEYINFEKDRKTGEELEADEWAQKFLIPENKYKEFCLAGSFLKNDILSFAEEINVPKGIVVGRLQHNGYIHFSTHNHLRTKLEWK